MLLAGLATPLAASTLTATMLTAISRVHRKNGPWLANGGYEYNAVLIAAALALAEVGPGPLSIDSALGDKLHGSGWALAALAGGIAGAAGAHLYAESQNSQLPPPAESTVEASSAEQPPPVA